MAIFIPVTDRTKWSFYQIFINQSQMQCTLSSEKLQVSSMLAQFMKLSTNIHSIYSRVIHNKIYNYSISILSRKLLSNFNNLVMNLILVKRQILFYEIKALACRKMLEYNPTNIQILTYLHLFTVHSSAPPQLSIIHLECFNSCSLSVLSGASGRISPLTQDR